MHGERLARTHMGYASQSLQNNGQVGLSCMVRRHVPPSTFDHGWESMCSASKAVYRVRTCMVGGTIALLTHRSPLNTKGDGPADRKIRHLGVGRAVVRISDVDIPRGGEPVLVGSPPHKRAVRPRTDRMGATWRPKVAT